MKTLAEWDSKFHMVLSDKSQIRGSIFVPFRMETGCVMRVQDAQFVPGLRYNVISLSVIERKGFEVLSQDGKARLRPRGSSFAGIMRGVRDYGLYTLTCKPIDHGKKKQEVQVQVPKKQVQENASEVQVHVQEKKVQILEDQRESISNGSLQVQRENL